MNTNETVREMTRAQYKDIIATTIGGIPDDLTFDEAQQLIGAKSALVSRINAAILKCAGRNAEAKTKPASPPPAHILRIISEGKRIMIPRCSGERTIAKEKEVFPGHRDPNFKDWGLDQAGKETPETPVSMYEMQKDARFAAMFQSLGVDLDRLTLTQDQIIAFVETHRDWLRSGGCGTSFLFKEDEEFFVADVRVGDRGLGVYVHRFEYDLVWGTEYPHRVVVPQLS